MLQTFIQSNSAALDLNILKVCVSLFPDQVASLHQPGSGPGPERGRAGLHISQLGVIRTKAGASYFQDGLLHFLQRWTTERGDVRRPLAQWQTQRQVGHTLSVCVLIEHFQYWYWFILWLELMMFFRGVLKWPDGRIYTGEFKNGLEDGWELKRQNHSSFTSQEYLR